MKNVQEIYNFVREYRQGKRTFETSFPNEKTNEQPYVVVILETFRLISELESTEEFVLALNNFVQNKLNSVYSKQYKNELKAFAKIITEYANG